jgi:hypothetical protein
MDMTVLQVLLAQQELQVYAVRVELLVLQAQQD